MEQSLKNAQISYSPELLVNLKDEHKILLNHMHSLSEAEKTKDLDSLPLLLDIFRSKMLAHVSKEILKLYIYLLSNLDHNSEQYKNVRAFRKEMDSMLIKILDFLDSYKDIEQIKQGKNFHDDLQQIITIFNDRIEREENILFPLYIQMSSQMNS